ncbi:glycosyltransferase family 2 protein [Acinetobacter schindleri]|uniref:glycosyltransferase family 2 protein n=1 Tax=Acinetobacter schindleri TaxID=108981 RepID=UPI00209A875D|nr:glycosyltransferase family 2 protein [Acinetobacter schindleri]MCO8068296.1 glycosyltransferase family 2 protein [Acinetobacter schindleri]
MNIFAVIVTYNPDIYKISTLVQSLLVDCVRVIVVDNCSSNFNHEFDFNNDIEIISLNKNFGIAYAQNIGINKAIALKAESIIFFDQDSNITDGFIGNLILGFKKIQSIDENIAAIGPRFIDEKKGFYFPALRFNKHGLIDKISVENISSPVEVSFLISSGTLVSVDALNDIGLMKEEFFIDFVDTEWCFRALSKGYKIYMSERAVMKHSIGDDTLKIYKFNIPVHSGFRRYYRIRNLFFMWKMSYIPKVLIIKLMITNFIIQILLFLIKDKKKEYLKFYIKAVKDGLKQSKDYQV